MFSGRYLWHFVAAVLCVAVILPFCSAQTLRVTPTELRGEEGSDFVFVCTGGSSLAWYRRLSDGTEAKLVMNAEFSPIVVMDNGTYTGTLTIVAAATDKTGDYICKQESDASSFTVSLSVYPVKDVVISPAEPEFVERADLFLNCTVNGGTDQTVVWTFNNGQAVAELSGGDDASHVQVFSNGTLIIRMVTPEDAGIYMCTHTFPEGSKTAEANVGGDITLTAEKSVKFTEGDRALLKCEAHVITAALLPNITWLVEGEEWSTACANRCKVEEPSTTSHTITSQLEINHITMGDRKNYTCIASNGAVEESRDILLRVRDRLAALWPFLGIVCEVVILIIIIFIHEKCSKGEDIGEEDEDEDDIKKEKKEKITDGDSEMRMRSTKQ